MIMLYYMAELTLKGQESSGGRNLITLAVKNREFSHISGMRGKKGKLERFEK